MKKLAIISLTLLAGVAAAQSSNADTLKAQCRDAKVVAELWHGFQGGAPKDTLESLAVAFNKTLKGACVQPISQGSYRDLSTKLKAAFASGKVPTMAQAFENNMALYLEAGQLEDLATLGVKTNYLEKTFVRANTFDGKLYGIPFNKSVQVMYYNKDLFSKHGVKVPTTLAQFEKAARDLSKKAGSPVFWYQPDASTFGYFYFTMGGTYGDGKKLVVNDATAVKALELLVDLTKDGAAKAITNGYINNQLGSGTFGMAIDTSAGMKYWESGAKFNLGMTTTPGLKAGYPGSSVIQGTNLVVFKGAPKAEKDLAARFLAFAETPRNSAVFAMATGYVPSNTLASRQPAFQDFLKSSPNYSAVLKQARYADFEPRLEQWEQIRFDVLGKAVAEAVLGKATPKAALDRAQKQVDDLMSGRTR
ncbi:multiple sugar transport system substrate-binding protein [Deinobacterium chartae]|uniref:Multiple sugar transport system substrate-binding protein n=1 Tax=Deinobacterium chartae TaxID=521158 RepID=A0A841HUY0_9DEIO|nr:ABC transporter substrate-binding protein [Deinobacterium chartae]MBB6096726.1 multiple sugar transport system substrate-binding protein [Deinobacterium chartae]